MSRKLGPYQVKYLLVMLFLFNTSAVLAQSAKLNALDATEVSGRDIVEADLYLLDSDQGSILTIEQILAGEAGQFAEFEPPIIYPKSANEGFWFRFSVKNESGERVTRVVDTQVSQLDELLVYSYEQTNRLNEILNIDLDGDFSERELPVSQLGWRIEIAPNSQKHYFVYLRSTNRLAVVFEIKEESTFLLEDSTRKSLLTFFVALMVFAVLLNLASFFGSDRKIMTLFLIRQIIYVFSVLQVWGFTFPYIWPNSAGFNAIAAVIFGFGIMAIDLIFTNVIFELRKTDKAYHNMTLIALVVILSSFAILVSVNVTSLVRYGHFFILPVNILILTIIIRRYKEGSFITRAYSYGISIAMMGTVLYALTYPSLNDIKAKYLLIVSIMIEACILGASIFIHWQRFRMQAFADKISLLETQNMYSEEKAKKLRAERDAARAKQELLEEHLLTKQHGHDITQPVFAAKMALSRLKKSTQDLESVGVLSQTLNQLSMILNSSMSRYEDSAPKTCSTISMSAALQDISRIFSSLAQEKGMELVLIPVSLRLALPEVDFKRVVSNLVVNAINHSRATKIVVGVRRTTQCYEVWVCDNGTGFSLESDVRAGALGLSIVADLCANNNWKFEQERYYSSLTVLKISIPRT